MLRAAQYDYRTSSRLRTSGVLSLLIAVGIAGCANLVLTPSDKILEGRGIAADGELDPHRKHPHPPERDRRPRTGPDLPARRPNLPVRRECSRHLAVADPPQPDYLQIGRARQVQAHPRHLLRRGCGSGSPYGGIRVGLELWRLQQARGCGESPRGGSLGRFFRPAAGVATPSPRRPISQLAARKSAPATLCLATCPPRPISKSSLASCAPAGSAATHRVTAMLSDMTLARFCREVRRRGFASPAKLPAPAPMPAASLSPIPRA